MRILVDHLVTDDVRSMFRDLNVRYQPDLMSDGPEALGRVLQRLHPDVLITGSIVDEQVAKAWRAAARQRPLIVISVVSEPEDQFWLNESGIIHRVVPAAAADDPYPVAFAMAERLWIEKTVTGELLRRLAPARAGANRSVTLVGAGVVNAVTALQLAGQGYDVTVVDRAPDPRDDDPWTVHGCTRGGHNARMFTLTEADGYGNEHYLPMGRAAAPFDSPVSAGGWRICAPDTLSTSEMSWLEQYSTIPAWLARSYTEDILVLNKRAGELWEDMIRSDPPLFGDAGIRNGILRLYSDFQHFRAQVARQDRVGALRRVLTPEEVGSRYPALAAACANKEVAGGIEVVGFTVQVHSFVQRLLDLLEKLGARLRWNCPVSGIHWTGHGVPGGLVVGDEVVRSDCYVLSPGAYGHELLRGTSAHDLIHGVLGVWMTTPNLEARLEHSLKIGRRGHRAEDTNVTVANDPNGDSVLIFGSGYGWTGADPSNIDADELEGLYQAVEDTVSRFVPGMYAQAKESGLLAASRRFCVRPWTPSSLGVFEIMQTDRDGLLIVTGGHNTGGFAQAPVIAEAVLAALQGEPHPMHHLYHPQRFRRCYE